MGWHQPHPGLGCQARWGASRNRGWSLLSQSTNGETEAGWAGTGCGGLEGSAMWDITGAQTQCVPPGWQSSSSKKAGASAGHKALGHCVLETEAPPGCSLSSHPAGGAGVWGPQTWHSSGGLGCRARKAESQVAEPAQPARRIGAPGALSEAGLARGARLTPSLGQGRWGGRRSRGVGGQAGGGGGGEGPHRAQRGWRHLGGDAAGMPGATASPPMWQHHPPAASATCGSPAKRREQPLLQEAEMGDDFLSPVRERGRGCQRYALARRLPSPQNLLPPQKDSRWDDAGHPAGMKGWRGIPGKLAPDTRGRRGPHFQPRAPHYYPNALPPA